MLLQAILIGFWLAVLALGLFIKERRAGSEAFNPAKWTGKSIDVAPLKTKLGDVRHDYLAARPTPTAVCFHKALLLYARRAITRLAYFRHHKPDEHFNAHTP
jgi:hypothetical protein